MKNLYRRAVRETFKIYGDIKSGLLTEEDLSHLPLQVKQYIRYTGSIGKEKVVNFYARFSGGMRFAPGEALMPLRSEQYNFMEDPSRLFYIVARRKGIPAIGLHLYRNARAIFRIKVLGLFTVVDASGDKMDQGETVTVLNDMCFIAPMTLISKRITWEVIDESRVRAVFTNGKIQVSAELIFNDKGELINFISNDRFETDGKEYKNYPWHTPVENYRSINGYTLPSKAKLIYMRPEGEFCYGEFELKELEYNCMSLR